MIWLIVIDWRLALEYLCIALAAGTLISVFVGVVATYWDGWDQT